MPLSPYPLSSQLCHQYPVSTSKPSCPTSLDLSSLFVSVFTRSPRPLGHQLSPVTAHHIVLHISLSPHLSLLPTPKILLLCALGTHNSSSADFSISSQCFSECSFHCLTQVCISFEGSASPAPVSCCRWRRCPLCPHYSLHTFSLTLRSPAFEVHAIRLL